MNKTSGGDGIPVKLFQILKDDAVKVLDSICQQIWKTQQWPQDWKRSFSNDFHFPMKRSFSFQSQRKAMPKNAQTTTQLHSSHMLAKECSKFSKPGFRRKLQEEVHVNCELPDVQAEFRKGKRTRDQIANIHGIIKTARVPEKHLFLLY